MQDVHQVALAIVFAVLDIATTVATVTFLITGTLAFIKYLRS